MNIKVKIEKCFLILQKTAISKNNKEYMTLKIEVPKSKENMFSENMKVMVFGSIVEKLRELETLNDKRPSLEIDGILESNTYEGKKYFNVIVSDFYGNIEILEKRTKYITNKERYEKIKNEKENEKEKENEFVENNIFDI